MTHTMPPPKKSKKSDQRKPYRMVRLPESLCSLLDKVVARNIGTDLSEHVRAAVRDYLAKTGDLPARPAGP